MQAELNKIRPPSLLALLVKLARPACRAASPYIMLPQLLLCAHLTKKETRRAGPPSSWYNSGSKKKRGEGEGAAA